METYVINFFTIGYEASDISDFIRTLKAAGVETLADVRDVTVSRKKGFSKNILRERLAENGIAYTHFRSLGDPKPGREAARRGEFELFRKIYGEHVNKPESQEAIKQLAEIAKQKLTCLMCYERDPKECHRTIVANHLADYGLISFELFVDKRDKYEQHPEKLPSHSSCKSASSPQLGIL